MKPLKILQVGKFYHPELGGMETVLRGLAEGLVQAGDQVTVLCANTTARSSEENLGGARILRRASLGLAFSQPLCPSLPFELFSILTHYDLIHLHSPNPLAEASVLGALRARRGPPLVVTYHSDVVRQRIALPLYRPMLRALLSDAAGVAVASRALLERSPFLRDLGSKCAVIPFGIDARELSLTPPIAAQAEELTREHGRFLLFVGRLVGYKGVAHLIEAMRDVPARLVVVGEGPLRRELETQAAGIPGKVRFLGRLADPERLAACYHACQALVLPSISTNEAFGMVQLEAMGWAKPTIVSRLDSGITEVNEDGVTGIFVEPASPKAIAGAARALLADDVRRLAMGAAARARFDRRFSRQAMVQGYRALYERSMKKEP